MATNNEVLFLVIPEYADWEFALLAPGLRGGGLWAPKYEVKVVAPDASPVMSMGGFRCLPDYAFDAMPDDYAALILVGGTGWWGGEAGRTLPIVRAALERKIVVGAICDASAFLGANGFLNNVDHTSNGLKYLKGKAGAAYTGEARYKNVPSVRDGNFITAGGAGFLDFACNMLAALDVTDAANIEMFRTTFAAGLYPEF